MLGIVVLLAAPGSASAANSFVERTGQTECWDEDGGETIDCYGTGQDGDLQRGGRWPEPRFKDLGNGWVLDRLTGLEWLKKADCAGLVYWQDALDFVYVLNNGDVECEQTNSSKKPARLPNVKELQSLIHYGFSGPAVPNTAGTGKWEEGDPFSGVPWAGCHWSSITHPGMNGNAWCVDLNYGSVNLNNKDFYNRAVWPVRGGK
jgi:hypothetical protein